jgi:copper transport protein
VWTVGEPPGHPPHQPGARVTRRALSRASRGFSRLAATLLAAGVALILSAGPASAHATLVSTDPPAGARLLEAPASVDITFSEQVEAPAGSVRLHDANGKTLETGAIQSLEGGRTVRLGIGSLADGGYVLSWRVLSADGHPVSGGVTWRVGTGGNDVKKGLTEQLLANEGGDAGVSNAAAAARALLFAGLILLVGGWAFAALPEASASPGTSGIARSGRRWLIGGGWASAVAGTVAGIGLQGADVAGLGLRAALRPSVIGDVLGTDYGRSALARLALLALALPIVLLDRRLPPDDQPSPDDQPHRVRRPARTWTAQAAIALGLTTTVAVAGHARTGRWTAVAMPLDVVHMLAGAVWLGGLAALLVSIGVATRDGDDDPTSPVVALAQRFSTVALAAVGVVVTTGVVQGIRQTGGVTGLLDNSYGRLLAAKVIGVGALVMLALLSRLALRARDDGTLPRLRQSVAGEVAMAVVILTVTSLLVAANPTRAGSTIGFSQDKVVEETLFELVVAPARTGPVDIHVYIQDPASGLTGVQEAEAILSLPARGIQGISVPLLPSGRNHFSGNDVDVPIKGDWEITIEVRIGELTQRTATFTVPIR